MTSDERLSEYDERRSDALDLSCAVFLYRETGQTGIIQASAQNEHQLMQVMVQPRPKQVHRGGFIGEKKIFLSYTCQSLHNSLALRFKTQFVNKYSNRDNEKGNPLGPVAGS